MFEFDHESKIGFFSFFPFSPGITEEMERQAFEQTKKFIFLLFKEFGINLKVTGIQQKRRTQSKEN